MVSTRLKLSLAEVTLTIFLLLAPADRVLSCPTNGFGDVGNVIFNVSEGAVQDKDTLCPLVELPEAYEGQVQAYEIWPRGGIISAATRNVINTPCLQNSAGLDRDTRASYSFILTATSSNGCGTGSINITLRLLDINDNSPSFHANTTSISYTIPENAAVHDSVGPGPVLAHDPDEGVNGTVRYRLERCNDVFHIHNSTGLITLKASPLDREMKDSYSCMVTASDLAVHNPRSASWEFDIGVGDVNDNAPHCSSDVGSFSLNMTENAAGILTFDCEDIDKDSNGTVSKTVILVNATLSNNISVTYREAFKRYALMVNGLDRERLGPGEDRYIIQLNISDEGSPPQVTSLYVTIFLEDVNDTPPQFEGPSSLSVAEDHVADRPVGKVKFTDPDLHSKLNYSLRQSMRGDMDIRLSANISVTDNGDIFVYNSSFLDFECSLPPQIILTVDVTDGLHTTTANVTLQITDVNDNSPVFDEPSPYYLNITENVALGTLVGSVTAQDADSDVYGEIRYTILTTDAPFMISETSGEITTSGPIDREKVGSYIIEVKAEDRGTPQRRHVTTQVNITVLDQDDNCPVFLQKEYNVEWYQDDVRMPFRVTATDDDSDAFNKVLYSLDRVIRFDIDKNSGIVSLRDTGQPNENTTLTVTAKANAAGGNTNCSPVEANLVIIFYGSQRPTTSPSASTGLLTIIAPVISVSVVLLIICIVLVATCVVVVRVHMRHSKEYNANIFSPAESPAEKATVARTKSILKSYNSDGADGKQKNSVRFVEVIETGNIHIFEPETPVSSPTVANGCPPQQPPCGGHNSQLSIDSSSCEDDLPQFVPLDYNDNDQSMNTAGNMNDCCDMEFRPPPYHPPTPPLSHRSLEERIPLQNIPFTTRQSESSAVPHNGHYPLRQEQQLPWSTHYHSPEQRNGVGLMQRRSGASFWSESGMSFTSDDRDSLSASLDNFSTYTEQGTDIMTQPGPMENLFSNLQQSSMVQRCVSVFIHACMCMCVSLEVSLCGCTKHFELCVIERCYYTLIALCYKVKDS